MIRKDYALCVEAISIALLSDADRRVSGVDLDLTDRKRAKELLFRLEKHVDFMCEQCEGLGRNIKLQQPCTYCAGSGIEPTADARLSFCAPEQIIRDDDVDGLGIGFIADDSNVVTGVQESEST